MKKTHFLVNLMLIFAFFNAFFLPFNFFSTKNVRAFENNQCNFTNLIVFAKFNNEDEFVNNIVKDTTTVKQLIENSYSLAEYSVKDYYHRVSNGKVKMQNVYLFGQNGGSLVLNKNRGYFFEKSENNPEGYEQSEYDLRMSELQQEWSSAIQSTINNGGTITNIDGSKTYSIDDLDKNGDGKIDSITIIYKYSNDYDGKWKGCLWNYQSYSNRITLIGSNNKTIKSNAYLQMSYDYAYSYINENGTLRFANLKTMIHEMGHIFGLKDLYNSRSESPIYYMSAMAQAISPVPQYLSSKEREVLGWLNSENVKKITNAGQYTVNVTSSEIINNVLSYKCDITSLNKTLYLEYRKFDGTTNKYDSLSKVVYNSDNNKLNNISIKSGLVCYLIDKDTTFPNNMNCNQYNWNYKVLGGQFATKTDSALAVNESLQITTNLSVRVISLTDSALTFKIEGTDISQTHTHSLTKIEFKDSTCTTKGNIEYFKCNDCNKYFLQDGSEIEYNDTIIDLKSHKQIEITGKNATCTEKGLTAGVKCENCGKILVQQNEIDKLDHAESEWIIDKNASTTETGLKHKECTNCGQTLKTETIPVLDDNDTDIDNPPFPPTIETPTKDERQISIVGIVFGIIIGLPICVGIISLIKKLHTKKRRP